MDGMDGRFPVSGDRHGVSVEDNGLGQGYPIVHILVLVSHWTALLEAARPPDGVIGLDKKHVGFWYVICGLYII